MGGLSENGVKAGHQSEDFSGIMDDSLEMEMKRLRAEIDQSTKSKMKIAEGTGGMRARRTKEKHQ